MTKNDNTITLFIKKLPKNAEALCEKLCSIIFWFHRGKCLVSILESSVRMFV